MKVILYQDSGSSCVAVLFPVSAWTFCASGLSHLNYRLNLDKGYYGSWPLSLLLMRKLLGCEYVSISVQNSPSRVGQCDPMDCSTPGFPVHHQLLDLTQIHVHWVSDAIQPSHPLLSPSPAYSPSQHQGPVKWVSVLHQVAKVLEF